MTKLINLIIKMLSAFSLFVKAAKNLYHAVRSGLKKLISAVKEGLKGPDKK